MVSPRSLSAQFVTKGKESLTRSTTRLSWRRVSWLVSQSMSALAPTPKAGRTTERRVRCARGLARAYMRVSRPRDPGYAGGEDSLVSRAKRAVLTGFISLPFSVLFSRYLNVYHQKILCSASEHGGIDHEPSHSTRPFLFQVPGISNRTAHRDRVYDPICVCNSKSRRLAPMLETHLNHLVLLPPFPPFERDASSSSPRSELKRTTVEKIGREVTNITSKLSTHRP